MQTFDIAVIGGGLVGAAIGYGLTRHSDRVAILDEGDVAYRAARGNFGLVWQQGKGVEHPSYAHWTHLACETWSELAEDLRTKTGIDIGYARPGGLEFCFSEQELNERQQALQRLAEHTEGRFQYEMLDNARLRALIPEVSPKLAGGSYSPNDGHANPLFLLRALHTAFAQQGGHYRAEHSVRDLHFRAGEFIITTAKGEIRAQRVVLAAGLGSCALAAKIGLQAPLAPLRGQILVTERVKPFLKLPTLHIRQTVEGSLLIGDSHEDVGFNDGTKGQVMAAIAARAAKVLPFLHQVNIVRGWGALRVMTPDGLPIYDESSQYPGVFLANCHSGVTLASAHAGPTADWIAGHKTHSLLSEFSAERFHVHQAA